MWSDVYLEAGTVRVRHQLTPSGVELFGPLKNGAPRTLDVSADVYSHAISEMQKGAAQKMGSLLHG